MSNNEEGIPLVHIIKIIQEYIRMLLSKWKRIALWSSSLACLVLTYSLIKKTTYIAHSSIMLNSGESGGGISSYLNLASQLGLLSGGGMALDEDKLTDILQARRIISIALLKKATIDGKHDFLAEHYMDVMNTRDDFDEDDVRLKNFRFKNADVDKLTYLEDSLIGEFYDHIIDKCLLIEKSSTSAIISIDVVKIPSELLSKYLCDNIVTAVTDFYTFNKTQQDRKNLEIIQLKADSIAGALNDAENRYARWKDASTRLIKVQGYIEEVKMKREMEILNIMYGETIKNLEMAKFNLLVNTPVVQIIDRPTLPLEDKRLHPVLGFLLGAFLGVFFTGGFLILKNVWKTIMEQPEEKLRN